MTPQVADVNALSHRAAVCRVAVQLYSCNALHCSLEIRQLDVLIHMRDDVLKEQNESEIRTRLF